MCFITTLEYKKFSQILEKKSLKRFHTRNFKKHVYGIKITKIKLKNMRKSIDKTIGECHKEYLNYCISIGQRFTKVKY